MRQTTPTLPTLVGGEGDNSGLFPDEELLHRRPSSAIMLTAGDKPYAVEKTGKSFRVRS